MYAIRSYYGPNGIGILTPSYNGIFTEPIPVMDAQGVNFISGSGATIVFIFVITSYSIHYTKLYEFPISSEIL